jgi:hypothetical protein
VANRRGNEECGPNRRDPTRAQAWSFQAQSVGISTAEHKAMSAGRNHDPATADQFYRRTSLER